MSPHDEPATIDLDDPEWVALAAAVRAEAPAPRAAFATELDARVAAGFPRERPAWARRPVRRLVPVLAVAATVAAGTVAVSSFHGGATDSSSSSSEIFTRDSLTQAPSGTAASGAVAAPASAPAPPARKVERTTSLDLTTSARGLQRAADGIVRATAELGGFVASSQVDATPTGGQASFALQLPATRLDDALRRFGALAHVARVSSGAQDITGAFTSAERRLADARAERQALLIALGRATTPRTIASLHARLAANRTRTTRLEGDLRSLRRRADLTRVDVTLRARGASAVAPPPGRWGPRDAARDALRVLAVVAGIVVVAAAALLPFALLGGLTAGARGLVRRRRREAALGRS